MKRLSLRETLDAVGLTWVTALLVAAMSSLIYAGPALWQTWTHDGPTLVTVGSGAGDGFVAGHDFVAFYSASQLVQDGLATLVYDETSMARAQHELVGDSSVGYLAFMYPPTYLLMVTPLASIGYFPALAVWLLIPLAGLLFAIGRGISVPPAALILVVAAPAIGQALFAGQNGLLFAALLAGGLLLHDKRPATAGILLGLATAKPHLAILIFPPLIAGRHWKVLMYAVGTAVAMVFLATALFGMEIWQAYASVPGMAREWLATGRLPWSRMPTIYTSLRLAGAGDAMATTAQAVTGLAVIGTVTWFWWKQVPGRLRCAAVLAGIPLVTPFLYDYDLPFMLTALALFLSDATARGWAPWEKPLLLLVWIQPVWWWTLAATVWDFSIAPIVYGLFFLALLRRIATPPSYSHPGPIRAANRP